MKVRLPRLHVVTDDAVLARARFLDEAEALLVAGGDAVALHVRGPHTEGRRVYELARALLAPAADSGGTLVVNDRLDVALAVGVRVVHLGGRSLPIPNARALLGDEATIGCSTHYVDEARAVAEAGADYVTFGSVRPTDSHPERPGVGWAAVERAVAAVGTVPLIAIGGLGVEDVAAANEAGAYGTAVVSGVWSAPDPTGALRDYISALERGNV